MMEWWKIGYKMKTSFLNEIEFLKTIIPIFHYSIIPSGEKPRINIKNLHLMKERA